MEHSTESPDILGFPPVGGQAPWNYTHGPLEDLKMDSNMVLTILYYFEILCY